MKHCKQPGRGLTRYACSQLTSADTRTTCLLTTCISMPALSAHITHVHLQAFQGLSFAIPSSLPPPKDFGSIYSTLLPGATAKLEPPEGQTVLDGLEVRVAFSGVWKDTLTELSGGQRYVCRHLPKQTCLRFLKLECVG